MVIGCGLVNTNGRGACMDAPHRYSANGNNFCKQQQPSVKQQQQQQIHDVLLATHCPCTATHVHGCATSSQT